MNEIETRAHESAREAGGVMPVAGDFRTPRVRVDVTLGGVVVAFAVAGLSCGPALGMGTAEALPVWSAVQLVTKWYPQALVDPGRCVRHIRRGSKHGTELDA